jgi:hypothetical protein
MPWIAYEDAVHELGGGLVPCEVASSYNRMR